MEVLLQLTNRTSEGHSLLGHVFDWIMAHVSHDEDLVGLTIADLQYLQSDLGLTRSELVRVLSLTEYNPTTLASAPPKAPVLPRAEDDQLLLDRMMEARGLDPAKVRHIFAALVREMELVCVYCNKTDVCRHNLRAGNANEHFHEYCGNAATFDEFPEASSKE
jgi:hypothetical protein